MQNSQVQYNTNRDELQQVGVKKLPDEWGIILDNEFESLLDPQVEIERGAFEVSLLKEGCRDALIVWRDTNVLIDGYHGFKFCAAHGIQGSVIYKDFTNRGEAREYIIMNQLARRNLPMHQRARLALELKPIYEARAKENLVVGAEMTNTGLQKSVKAVNTQKELAKVAGVSHDSIDKVSKIERDAPEPIKRASRRGEISVNAAYEVTKLPEEKRQEIIDKAERGEQPIKQIVRDAINAEKEGSEMQTAANVSSAAEEMLARMMELPASTYNLDDFIEEITMNGEDYVRGIRRHIEARFAQFDSPNARKRLRNAINVIINDFRELKGEYENA